MGVSRRRAVVKLESSPGWKQETVHSRPPTPAIGLTSSITRAFVIGGIASVRALPAARIDSKPIPPFVSLKSTSATCDLDPSQSQTYCKQSMFIRTALRSTKPINTARITSFRLINTTSIRMAADDQYAVVSLTDRSQSLTIDLACPLSQRLDTPRSPRTRLLR